MHETLNSSESCQRTHKLYEICMLHHPVKAKSPTSFVTPSWTSHHTLFFLDNAALVITTVAVMKICYNSHRLITRSSRLVSGQQKSKETQTNPHNNQPKPTKSDQSVVRQVKHVCALTTWCIAQKPRLSQHLQQLIECHTSNT